MLSCTCAQKKDAQVHARIKSLPSSKISFHFQNGCGRVRIKRRIKTRKFLTLMEGEGGGKDGAREGEREGDS